MRRQPNQVLVIPYRKNNDSFQYGIFKRSDASYWQFIAGGADDLETPMEAAIREASEEAGIPLGSNLMALDSISSMPANIFKNWAKWPKGTYIVKEYSFGIDFSDGEFILSDEHTEAQWCSLESAMSLLKWDSNRTALWALSQRLSNP